MAAMAPIDPVPRISCEPIMPVHIDRSTTEKVLNAIGEVNTLIAQRFGELKVGISDLAGNFKALQANVEGIERSLQDLKGEIAKVRTDYRQDVNELEARMARDITRVEREKVQSVIDSVDNLGTMIENASVRIDELAVKVDRLDGVTVRVARLEEVKNEVVGWQQAIQWLAYPVTGLIGWMVSHFLDKKP